MSETTRIEATLTQKLQSRILDTIGRNPRILFILCVACNVGYVVLCIIYHLYFNPAQYGDLRGTWLPTVDRYLIDMNSLYDEGCCPFKNLPQLIYPLMAFYFMPGDTILKIVAFSVSVLVTSLGTFVVARKNYMLLNQDTTKALMLASIGLIMTAQIADHMYSQFNVAAGLCLVISFYGLLKGNERVQYIFLGLSIMFKHITIFMIPILLFQGKFKIGKFIKRVVIRLAFVALPLFPSIVLFLLYPNLIPAIIEVNTNVIGDLNNLLLFAGSLTKFLTLYGSMSPNLALLISGIIGYGVFLLLLKQRTLDSQDLYIIASFVTMFVSPEFYGQHYIIFSFFIVLWAIKCNKRHQNMIWILIFFMVASIPFLIPLSSLIFLAAYILDKYHKVTI